MGTHKHVFGRSGRSPTTLAELPESARPIRGLPAIADAGDGAEYRSGHSYQPDLGGVMRPSLAHGVDGPSRSRVLAPLAGGWSERIAVRLGRRHRFLSVVSVIAVCYIGMALLLIGSGLAFTHVVAHGRIGHWDDHVNTWFAAHRSSTWTKISADLTLVADTLGVAVAAAAVTALLLVRRPLLRWIGQRTNSLRPPVPRRNALPAPARSG